MYIIVALQNFRYVGVGTHTECPTLEQVTDVTQSLSLYLRGKYYVNLNTAVVNEDQRHRERRAMPSA